MKGGWPSSSWVWTAPRDRVMITVWGMEANAWSQRYSSIPMEVKGTMEWESAKQEAWKSTLARNPRQQKITWNASTLSPSNSLETFSSLSEGRLLDDDVMAQFSAIVSKWNAFIDGTREDPIVLDIHFTAPQVKLYTFIGSEFAIRLLKNDMVSIQNPIRR